MAVQIGAKTQDFSDPTGLLSDCHRRIEMFLGVLQRVAQMLDSPLPADARDSFQTALRYFQDAAPKHTQDEEESLFPRLRGIQHPEIEMALSALNALEHDHRRADALHSEVHQLGLKCLENGNLSVPDAVRFRRAVGDLTSIYGEHIRIEDDVVFPAAQRELSRSQKDAIASEMRSRRELIS